MSFLNGFRSIRKGSKSNTRTEMQLKRCKTQSPGERNNPRIMLEAQFY